MTRAARTGIAVAVIAAVAVALFLAAFRPAREAEPIRIGAVLPLSAARGRGQQLALRLARENINAEGGIRGRRLEFIFEDSKGQAAVGASAARKLIDVDHVRILFGFPCAAFTFPASAEREKGESTRRSELRPAKLIAGAPMTSLHTLTHRPGELFRPLRQPLVRPRGRSD